MDNRDNNCHGTNGDNFDLNNGGNQQFNCTSRSICGAMCEQPYDPTPSYNAFREDVSVAAVVQKKRPFYIQGPEPLAGEPFYEYVRRTDFERAVIKNAATKEAKRSLIRLSLIMLLYTLLNLVIPSSLLDIFDYGGGMDTALGTSVCLFLVYIAIYPGIFSVLIYLGNLGTAHSVKSFFRKPECNAQYILKMMVIVCGASYVTSILYGMVMDAVGVGTVMTAEPFTSVFDGISNFIAFCIFAPVFEEIIFRGVFLSNHMKFGGWHACIVSALFFALFHLNHEQLPYAFVAGLLLALVTLKSGSLIPSILIHAAINFISILQMLAITMIDNYGEVLTDPNWRPQGSLPSLVFYVFVMLLPYLIMLVGVIMLVVELRSNKGMFMLPCGDSGLSAGEKAKAFVSSPLAVIAVIVMVLIMVVTGVSRLLLQ